MIFLPHNLTGMHYMGYTFTKYNKGTVHVIDPVRIGGKNRK